MDTKAILEKVKKDYDSIAEEFDTSRKSPWPEFAVFKKQLEKKENKIKKQLSLLDLGCGNGRLAATLQDKSITYTGIDISKNLLKHAKKNAKTFTEINTRFLYGDIAKRLQFSAATFDSICAIAVLHHLPTHKLQLQLLQEIRRVLKQDGFAFITVWNLWQPKYRTFIDKKTHHSFIAWGSPVKTRRFYYAFQEKELKQLMKEAGFTHIRKIRSSHNFAFLIS